MNIAVLDDHPCVLEGIVDYLSDHLSKYYTYYPLLKGKDLEDLILNKNIDIVVLDLALEDRNGLEILSKINFNTPDIKVIVHTGSQDFGKFIRTMKYGAKGYITKSESLDELVNAIKNAVIGGPFYAKKMEKIYAIQLDKMKKRNNIDSLDDLLTDHEKNVLTEFITGDCRKLIADRLNVVPGTVDVHISNIMIKFGVKTTVGLVKYCLENNYQN